MTTKQSAVELHRFPESVIPENVVYVLDHLGMMAMEKKGSEFALLGYVDPKDFIDNFSAPQKISTPILPQGTFFYGSSTGDKSIIHSLAVQLSPFAFRLNYLGHRYGHEVDKYGDRRRVAKTLKFPVPWIQIYLSIRENSVGNLSLKEIMMTCSPSAVKTHKDHVYQPPFANVNESYWVCWGYASTFHNKKFTSFDEIVQFVMTEFFSSQFNDDYEYRIFPAANLESYCEKFASLDFTEYQFARRSTASECIKRLQDPR